jgi:hypothetical protein
MVDEQEMALRIAEADAWHALLATSVLSEEFKAAFDRWITAMDAKHTYLQAKREADDAGA